MKTRKALIHQSLGDKTNTTIVYNMFSFKEYEFGVEIKPYGQSSIVLSDVHAMHLTNALIHRMKKKKFLESL